MKNLNRYELHQFNEIEKWIHEDIDLYDKTMAVVTKPFGKVVEKVATEKIVRGLLKFTWNIADSTLDYKRIKKSVGISDITMLRDMELEICDKLARDVKKSAISIGTIQGITVGSIGIVGLAVDIPFILSIALRTIMKIGACYGYELNSIYEKEFALAVLGAGSVRKRKQKEEAVNLVYKIEEFIEEDSMKILAGKMVNKTVSKELSIMSVHAIEHELEIEISREIQMLLFEDRVVGWLPIVGGTIGAAINARYINHVANAAMRLYQHRWLIDNEKISTNTRINLYSFDEKKVN
ncbi:MAG: EcsC family protein [Sarcina sp.]